MMAGTRLESARLVLRPHAVGDAPAVARLLDNWDVAQWLVQAPYPYTEAEARAWIRQASRRWHNGAERQFAICLKGASTESLIGHAGLRLEKDGQSAELGYWLGEPHWGRGYATEACGRILRYGFEDVRAARIWATALPDNARSFRVLAKLGFARSGSHRQRFGPREVTVDAPVWSVDRDTYLAARQRGAA